MNTKSIYTVICDSLTPEGKLPKDFILSPKDISLNVLRFMPGAKEGISLFHFGSKNPSKVAKKIVKLIENDLENGEYYSLSKIAIFLHKYDALSVIEAVIHYLEDHEGLDAKNIVDYAGRLAFETADMELVKLGIRLLGLNNLSHEKEIVDKLIILALYEEFTLYVSEAILNWQNGNDILFRIAKNVYGWGKIHVVNRLLPLSDEIREWILLKGCANEIMDAYLGLGCAMKGDLINALKSESVDNQLYDSISVIINALLYEGPVDGISAYKYAEEALERYLLLATQYAVTAKHLYVVLNVQAWLKYALISNKDLLEKLCLSIVNRFSWHPLINNTLDDPNDEQFFYACDAASRLNLDISEAVFSAIKKNPLKHYGYLSIVYKIPDYAKQITEIYEKTLPLSEMALGMGNYIFLEKLSEEYNCLNFALQELGKYPKMGERLVHTAIQSPVVRIRRLACSVMKEWTELLNQPIRIISPCFYLILKNTSTIEIDSDIKKSMKKLLKS